MTEPSGRAASPAERRTEAIARAERERFPAVTLVVAGVVLCLVAIVQLLILVLAGAAVRMIENWRIAQLRSATDQSAG